MFFSFDYDELSQYLEMLYEETSCGTSDYDGHDLNPLYWDLLLKPISSEPEKWEDKVALDFGTSRGRNLKNLDGLASWKELHGVDLSKKNIDENDEASLLDYCQVRNKMQLLNFHVHYNVLLKIL